MPDWEKTLALLDQQGWEYTGAKCIDLETGRDCYLVSVTRGEANLTSLWPDLAEAAKALQNLVQAAS